MAEANDPVSEKFNSPDADIVLRSAKVKARNLPFLPAEPATLFRAYSYRLKAFSPVFRDMLALGEAHGAAQTEPIQLEESAETLSWLLLLMQDEVSSHPFLAYEFRYAARMLDVYRAAIKYACGTIQQLLEGHLL